MLARVERIASRPMRRAGARSPGDGRGDVSDGSGRMKVTFFNQAWREKQLHRGPRRCSSGKLEDFRGTRQLTNPVVDLVGDQTGAGRAASTRSPRRPASPPGTCGDGSTRRCDAPATSSTRCPRRSSTASTSSTGPRRSACIHVPGRQRRCLRGRPGSAWSSTSCCACSSPSSCASAGSSRPRSGVAHDLSRRARAALPRALPYPLTGAQARVIAEIEADLAAPGPHAPPAAGRRGRRQDGGRRRRRCSSPCRAATRAR